MAADLAAEVSRTGRTGNRSSWMLAAIAAGILSCWPAGAGAGRGESGRFDYWTLTVSWSPSFCATRAGRNDRHQCGPDRAYAFVVHGLWPQYRRGWPEYCRTAHRRVSRHVQAKALAIMPSPKLVIHEWKKHGTCSGLTPSGYFDLTARLFDKIKIPARYLGPRKPILTSPQQMARDFLSTNRWLAPEMISIHCGNRRDRARLREIRFCFDRGGTPSACGANERRQCRAKTLVLLPVR